MPAFFSYRSIDDWFLAVIAGFIVFFVGEALLRAINRKIERYSPDGKGIIANINNSLYFPLALLIFVFGIKVVLKSLPVVMVRPIWIENVNFLVGFLLIIIICELFFCLLVDYYLREKRGTELPKIFSQLIKAIVYVIIGLSFASTIYKIDITPLLTTSAVFTMVIGLALQDVLSNLFAGLSVHISPPFKIGDWIKIGEWYGKVLESNWRATTLLSPINELIVLPNNDISKKEISNLSFRSGYLYREFNIGLSYDTSPEKARKTLLGACRQVKEILHDPPPKVLLVSFDDFSIAYKVRYWIADSENQDVVKNQLGSRIWYRLKRDGLTVPFPIREVYTHSEKDQKKELLEQRIRIVSSIDFIAGLSRENRVFLAENLRELWFESGETLFSRGSTGQELFIIDRGKVSVYLSDELVDPIASLTDGDFFGEMSFLTGEPRSATIVADMETCVLILKKDVLGDLLNDNPEIANILSVALANRKQANIQKLSSGKSNGETRSEYPQTSVDENKSRVILEKIKRFFRLR
ncbi:MAG: mechanosensitive ion channel family protein [Candidatus Riflebacteria bacterium]|nr:mechanosensitive ion channel family protein [Candidatus Riflebacteria bacterium]